MPIERIKQNGPAAAAAREEETCTPRESVHTPAMEGLLDSSEDSAPTEPQPISGSGLSERLPFPGWERYEILRFLGAGGMGSVYLAHDPRLNRKVAIKFLRSTVSTSIDPNQRRRFDREARAQASIEHPHICKIPVGC